MTHRPMGRKSRAPSPSRSVTSTAGAGTTGGSPATATSPGGTVWATAETRLNRQQMRKKTIRGIRQTKALDRQGPRRGLVMVATRRTMRSKALLANPYL